MTVAKSAVATGRSTTTWAAFIVGLPLAGGILAIIHFGPLRHTIAHRYVSHAVECVEVVMFCCALAALAAKFWRSLTEWAACRKELLPPWDGQAIHVTEADKLLPRLTALPRRLQGTYQVRRVAAVLEFLSSRGSANQIDDQLRTLADNDALALEGSYSLTRFITWAIPILGFLGTVLGITQAISGVTPEVLEQSLSTVTDGLALAFDATALGLALTMVTMFCSFVVERRELGILEAVDRYADQELAHRFEHTGSDGADFAGVVRQNTQALIRATEQVVQRQAEVWAKTFQEMDSRRAEAESKMQERFVASLEAALERTLETHSRRLASLEKQAVQQGAGLVDQLGTLTATVRAGSQEQQAALAKVAQMVTAQIEGLARLQEGERHLVRLQEALHQNLEALAGAGAFEQAVHSLTAAIHLLTARAGGIKNEGNKGPSLRLAGQLPPEKGAA